MSARSLALGVLLAATFAAGSALAEGYDFELYDLGDRLLSLRKIRQAATLVVVDFFAESCAPCKAALPAWRELHRRFGARGLALIVVAVPDESDRTAALERVVRYFKGRSVAFPVGWDKYRRVAKQYGVLRKDTLSVPSVFLLDGDGALVLKSEKVAPIRQQIERRLR